MFFLFFFPHHLKVTLGDITTSMVETYEQLSSTVDQNEVYRVGANILDVITNIYKVFANKTVYIETVKRPHYGINHYDHYDSRFDTLKSLIVAMFLFDCF